LNTPDGAARFATADTIRERAAAVLVATSRAVVEGAARCRGTPALAPSLGIAIRMPPRAGHMPKSEQKVLPDRRKLRVLRRIRPQPLSFLERDVDPQRTLAKVDYVLPTEVSHCAKILGRCFEAIRASRGSATSFARQPHAEAQSGQRRS
jgi:hypothetical protein